MCLLAVPIQYSNGLMPRSSATTLEAIHRASFDLFHKRGYARVSMDDIAAAAGVTKKGLYYHYDSKDALVSAVLYNQLEHSLRSIRKWGEPPSETPEAFVKSIFEQLERWSRTQHWTGSGFTRLTMELADMPGHPVRQASSKHKTDIEDWIGRELQKLGAENAGQLARTLCILVEGATVLTLIHGNPEYFESAYQSAVRLISKD